MRLKNVFKHRGLGINLLAGFCFIMLATFGWGLEWNEVFNYLFILLVMLSAVIGSAAGIGFLLRLLRRRRDRLEDDKYQD
jgi:hypothetical protein